MRSLFALGTALSITLLALVLPGAQVESARPRDDAALDPLERLLAGNRRFASGEPTHFGQDLERRKELARGQHPFAVIVGCADSRVPPEIVFDQGLGDLFVVRSAGEALDDLALASLEYAVEHLGASTIVVLGHERCGAVEATLGGGELPGHSKYLARALAPHLEPARRKLPARKAEDEAGEHGRAPAIPADVLDEAVCLNVRAIVAELRAAEPILSELEHAGELRIVGARYDLDTGLVELLPEPGAENAPPRAGSAAVRH